VASLSLLLFHGANYMQLRTEGVLAERARTAALIFGVTLLLVFSLGGVMVAGMQGYQITSAVVPGEAVSPVGKTVVMQAGAWMSNYQTHPWTWALTALGYGGIALGLLAAFARAPGLAFIGSGMACAGIILTSGVAIFPFVLPSISHPSHSLTVWDCVSSQRTLNIMFWVAMVMTPIVLAYTTWAYRVMRGKVTLAQVQEHGKALY
jgi:cytochrome d ubiquinol oxidase subunit II